MIGQYSSYDVSNEDKAGIYFKAFKTHAFKNDRVKEKKTSKERSIILCCASMNGEKHR